MADQPGLLQRLSAGLTALARRPPTPPLSILPADRTIRVAPAARSFGPGFYDTNPQGWTIVRGDNPTHYQATGRSVRIIGWERHPIVNACCRLIANVVAPIPFEAVKTDASGDLDGEVEVLARSPIADLLNNPRPNTPMSGHYFRSQTVLYRELYGNALWYLDRTKNGNGFDGPTSRLPNALWLIQPENLQYLYLDPVTLEAGAYLWRDRTGRSHMSPVQDIVHFRDLNGSDFLFGYPRAAAALQDIATDNEASQYVREVFANHGLPAAILRFEATANDDDVVAAVERFKSQMSERGGRGQTVGMKGVEALETIAFSLRDLEFPDLRQVTREDICAAFGVDPRLVSATSAKGQEAAFSGEQYSEARFRLVQQTVRPILSAIEADINAWLSPEFGDVHVRFNRATLAKVTEDITETSTRTLAQVQQGVLSIEEWREQNGYERDFKPADTLLRGNQVPVADRTAILPDTVTLRETAPAVVPADPDDPNAPTAGAPASAPPAPTGLSRRVMTRAQRATLTPNQRRALWDQFDQRATSLETSYHREAALQFARERTGVRALFEQASVRARSDDPYLAAALQKVRDDYAPSGQYHQDWLDRYLKLIGETTQAGAKDVLAGTGFDFQLTNPHVQAAIHQRANKLADYVTQTTANQITDVVKAGREAGLGISQIADTVDQAVFAGNAPARARMIARTESAGALNQGEFESARISGVFPTKEWLSQGDDRVREGDAFIGADHVELDGQQQEIEAEFAPGLQHPGDQNADASAVINCRCSLLYLTD